MIGISPRFASPIAALAALATIPIWWHFAAAPTFDPCVGAGNLFLAEQIGGGVITARDVTATGEGRMDGRIESLPAGVALLVFRVERSFAPSAFYGSLPLFAFVMVCSRGKEPSWSPKVLDA